MIYLKKINVSLVKYLQKVVFDYVQRTCSLNFKMQLLYNVIICNIIKSFINNIIVNNKLVKKFDTQNKILFNINIIRKKRRKHAKMKIL